MHLRKPHPRVKAKEERIARAKKMLVMLQFHTLAEVGKAQTPPISPQRVGQLIASLET